MKKRLEIHTHALGDSCHSCLLEARRDGEIKGLLRAARQATSKSVWAGVPAAGVVIADWCRSEAARLRRGR